MSVAAKTGDRASQIMRDAVEHGQYQSSDLQDRRACQRLNGKGLLTRDKKDADLWFPTKRLVDQRTAVAALADAIGADHDRELAAAAQADASGLVATVQRARALLDDGDVMRARIVAAAAYDQAKTEAAFAEKFGATEALVAKARRLQGDALLIETRAKILISNEWDAAHAAGLVSKGGRPKGVSDGNELTAENTGLSRKELHEARKLAAAEGRSPGLVEKAINARLAAGLSATRANLRAAVGTASATKEERGQNLYETPPEAMFTLLALEDFTPTVLEPACGRGAIARMLEQAGYGVVLADLVDYETADQHGELQDVQDFLASEPPESGSYDIVTNPPYGDVLNAFVAHALRVFRPGKMALLLNLNFLCGFADDDRNFVMDDCPPARVWIFKRRLPMMHRDGWDGNKASSRMNTAWFVWELQPDGSYGTQTITKRVDWRDFLPEGAAIADAESEAA
ncbi:MULTISPECIES: class I SAM-dependent methyltransferase [unclassified Rhizobium]|uniref:class I SAM-dependent methyltransferase n=1 Tax=unclassified Rhizobium TaxID=2613769 RepID=UPI00179FA179|nr:MULTISPECIES: class I SAM-dependent methyltransferase [unclassified Rhizobium]MBB3288177.1 hypothetical protein [Rhizobium sp. BK252]MBB3402959.1 hypothetical protein [Rhizobium sp. BK289]MBB3415536.1 hypothetical protein [Rhizobium sp. BK284]MBB3483383.1 hypothetical protein [Rhizobium sp. BK347]